jgi:hypothetical protein
MNVQSLEIVKVANGYTIEFWHDSQMHVYVAQTLSGYGSESLIDILKKVFESKPVKIVDGWPTE